MLRRPARGSERELQPSSRKSGVLRGNTPLFAAGDGDLLLQEDAECLGFTFVSEEEEEMIKRLRASNDEAA